MHHTDTIDLDTISSGSIELLLDDGAHSLERGDCVVVAGVEDVLYPERVCPSYSRASKPRPLPNT